MARHLHQANAELRDLNQLKNQFLGMAAHDLRNPVGIIMMFGRILFDEAGEQLSAEQREYLSDCLEAAGRMKQIIDNFLNASIIESGKLRLALVSVSAAEILAGVEPIARLMAGRKKMLLEMDAGIEDRRLLADSFQLQQVLVNLVGNAMEHSNPGQRVWVSARWENENLIFAVRDEGVGISMEEQARLFVAYGPAGAQKTAGERSVGLGLAIARIVVEAHHGRIWVESTPGHGATFRVSLPASGELKVSA